MIYNTKKFKAPEVVESKFIRVSMLNKGMYVQDFHLPSISRDKPPLKFKAVSAHLDSFNQNNRLREWQRGHETLYPRVRNFKELAQAIPDCMFGGGDMNTRLKLGRDKNPWGPEDSSEETKAYNQCPLGQVQYSKKVTYDKVAYKNLVAIHKSKLIKLPDEDPEQDVTQQEGKRKGEQDRGYLDVCWGCTGQESDVSPKVAETFDFTSTNQRDHAAVLSAVQEFRPYETDLARVEAHVLTHMKLFDQGQASEPEKGVFNQLKQALSSATPSMKKELLVSYYNRYVVELPKQIFDAHRISDLKTRIEALELITQSRILADVYDKLQNKEIGNLKEKYHFKKVNSRYPYPFDISVCDDHIKEAIDAINPNDIESIESHPLINAPSEIQTYFAGRLATLRLLENSNELNDTDQVARMMQDIQSELNTKLRPSIYNSFIENQYWILAAISGMLILHGIWLAFKAGGQALSNIDKDKMAKELNKIIPININLSSTCQLLFYAFIFKNLVNLGNMYKFSGWNKNNNQRG